MSPDETNEFLLGTVVFLLVLNTVPQRLALSVLLNSIWLYGGGKKQFYRQI